MMAVALEDAATLRFGTPELLFAGDRFPGFLLGIYPGLERDWDIAHDGRFLMAAWADEMLDDTAAETAADDPVIVILQNLFRDGVPARVTSP